MLRFGRRQRSEHTAATERWCPRCGKRCGVHANFCENCGASLQEGLAPAPEQAHPALLPLGASVRAEREKQACPFPLCATAEEILLVAEEGRKKGWTPIFGAAQAEVTLRAAGPGKKGLVIASFINARTQEREEVALSRQRAATGQHNSALWFVGPEYDLLPRRATPRYRPIEIREEKPAPTASRQSSPSAGTGAVNVWRLITHHERAAEMAEWSRREGVIAVGWGGTGDLRQRGFHDQEELTRIVGDAHSPISVSSRVHGGRSLWRLYAEMRPGDLVILSIGGARVLTMRVTGDYYFVEGEYPYYEHRRKAEATPIDPNLLWQLSGGAAPGEPIRSTLIRCARALPEAEFSAR